jgi:hypothetical protein
MNFLVKECKRRFIRKGCAEKNTRGSGAWCEHRLVGVLAETGWRRGGRIADSETDPLGAMFENVEHDVALRNS